ncbi:MAG: peptidylprolyl isomerase [Rickettsiaceae bacterium]
MINQIRTVANSIPIRILFALIVVSFIAWGVKDVASVNNNAVITFNTLDPITQQAFQKEKLHEINLIRQQNTIDFNESDIHQLQINQLVIQKLIQARIMSYITKYYDFDIGDEFVIRFIKTMPIFHNDEGKFNPDLFRAFLKYSHVTEVEYVSSIKQSILNDVFNQTFVEAFNIPNILTDNILEYLSNTKIIDLLQMNLEDNHNINQHKPSQLELEEFYNNNPELFYVPEKRNISYIEISKDILKHQINITDYEIMQFYQEHKDEYQNQSFVQMKSEIYQYLMQQKFDEINFQLIKTLEDEIDSGLSMKEIAQHHDFPMAFLNQVSKIELSQNPKLIGRLAESIFDMNHDEILYPIQLELDGSMYILLVQLHSILPEYTETLENSTSELLKLWLLDNIRKQNLQNFTNLVKEYPKNASLLNKKGILVEKNMHITKADAKTNSKLPQRLLEDIFHTKPQNITPPIVINDVAYAIYVRSEYHDINKIDDIDQYKSDISKRIKTHIEHEYIDYFIKKEDVKVNYNILQLN